MNNSGRLFFRDNSVSLFNGDCRSMYELPDNSVQMVVTSPPYWGLRKYAGEQDLIWGDNHCEHEWGSQIETGDNRFRGVNANTGGNANPEIFAGGKALSQFCSPCGAWRGAYGLEPTPELYVQHTIEILREIRRVLRKDGCVFWNIGDSYFGGGNNRGNNSPISDKQASNFGAVGQCAEHQKNVGKHQTIKPKDLCLIPFRVALETQRDGWWVRSVIIWNKLNPMPESITDRPTESHEYILMLTKNKNYYWDAEAVREPYTEPLNRWGGPEFRNSSHKYIELGGHDGEQHYGATSMFRKGRPVRPDESGRNLRSVWTFPTQGYPEAHFATFPEKLPELCIKAATPEVGCCSKCGKPYERIVKVVGHQVTDAMKVAGCNASGMYAGSEKKDYSATLSQQPSESKRRILESMSEVRESEWKPACNCNAEAVPSIVLDPFAGSGTTLAVAKREGRRAIGYELSSDYCKLAKDRVMSVTLPLLGLFV